MKYATALKDYNHILTGEQVLTKGVSYLVFKEKQQHYWICNDNGKYMWVYKNLFRNELFEVGEQL